MLLHVGLDVEGKEISVVLLPLGSKYIILDCVRGRGLEVFTFGDDRECGNRVVREGVVFVRTFMVLDSMF